MVLIKFQVPSVRFYCKSNVVCNSGPFQSQCQSKQLPEHLLLSNGISKTKTKTTISSLSKMDWAEELKMSIRKTTARKGRRSKSREQGASSSSTAATSPKTENEIAIDITLDMQQSSSIQSSTATPQSGTTANSDSSERPPLRRISGGWADSSILKSSKSKKGSFDDERFQFSSPKSATSSPPKDDIPIIPDLDDIKDEILLNEIAEPPSVTVNRVVTLKELNSDLLSQNAFSAIEDVDLSILTRCLQAQDSLDEADEVWEWNKLFTDVIAEIHSDEQNLMGATGVGQKKEIGPDEIPPAMHA